LYLRPYAARPYACETQFPRNIISLAPKLNDFFSSNCYVAPVLLVDVKHWMDVVVWCCNENDHPKISRWCLIYFVSFAKADAVHVRHRHRRRNPKFSFPDPKAETPASSSSSPNPNPATAFVPIP
jgi:hypothetical protein